MKKIILLACDPGGANTVAPLLESLKRIGYNVALFGKNAALMRYEVIGAPAFDLNFILKKRNYSGTQLVSINKPLPI